MFRLRDEFKKVGKYQNNFSLSQACDSEKVYVLKEIQPIIAYTPEELFYCTKQASLSERVHFQWFQRFTLKSRRESIVSIQNGTRLRGGWKSPYYNLLGGFDFYLCPCS